MNQIMKVALYVRVSTEEQAEEGYSIEAQLDTLRNYCSKHGYTVVREYADEGISGKDIVHRPALKSMLKDSTLGIFNCVLVWKISRLSRKLRHQLEIADNFTANNILFKSVTENFDNRTSSGKFSFQIIGATAEYERNTISENVTLAMKHKARKGEWNGGKILGYDLVEGILVVNEEESQLVQKIFNLYCQGKGLKSIANHLNCNGYTTKNNYPFSTTAIKTIVENPTYIGKIRWGQYKGWSERRRKGKTEPIISDGMHQPIITITQWELTRSISSQRTHKPSRQYTGKFPLAGFLRCPECGSAMVGTNHTRKLKSEVKHYRQYVCGKFHRSGSSVCSSNMVKADYIEQLFIDRLANTIQHPEIIREIIRKVNTRKKQQTKPLLKELETIEKNEKQLDVKQDKAIQLCINGTLSEEILSKQLKKIEIEKKQLVTRKTEISMLLSETNDMEIPEGVILNSIKDFSTVYQQTDVEKQKLLLKSLVKDVTLTPKRELDKITLQFNIPRKNQKECSPHQSAIEDSGEELPSHFSHSFMIRFSTHYPKCTIHLLNQHTTHELVWKRKRRKGQSEVRTLCHSLMQS